VRTARGGRADRRIRERTAKQYKKVRHPAAPSDTPWSCFTFYSIFPPNERGKCFVSGFAQRDFGLRVPFDVTS